MHLAYLFAAGLGGLVWATIFFFRPDLRAVQLTMSAIGIPLAVSDLFYVPQYWRPQTIGGIPVGIEGVLFSFEAAGICAVIYPAVFGKRFGPKGNGLNLPGLIPALLPLPVSAAISLGLHTNLEWGLYAGLVAACLATALMRPDLGRPQLLGGLAFLPLYAAALLIWIAVFPSVHGWFTLRRMPHWFLLGVPLEEIVFGGLFAAFWTGLYPMVFERRFMPLPDPMGDTSVDLQTASGGRPSAPA